MTAIDRAFALLPGATDAAHKRLRAAVERCADPQTAVTRLERFADAAGGLDAERFAASPDYARMLLTILDESHFLSDIIGRRPQLVAWLADHGDLKCTPEIPELVARLNEDTRDATSMTERIRAIRLFRQREILRIAARDIVAHASLRAVTLDLSNLADAAAQTAWTWARDEFELEHGAPQTPHGPAQFVVLGMGKLGGRELNFSSDIDLIFLFSDDGETEGGTGRSLSNHEYFHKLGERIFKYLADETVEGRVFRVDMRLRPHGSMAPLAVTLDNAITYYAQSGQAWERQALIKVRPIAGDLSLGEEFIHETRPFVFPRFFDDETLESIRQIKAQMEARLERDGTTNTEVKLGRGGIRDVEFTIQMLQLLNGGRIPDVRAPHTLDAIAALGEQDILTPFEANTLAQHYTFMRQVEHRIQIEGSQQRHALPRDPAALDRLGKRLGYESGEAFMNIYNSRADETRHILEQYLAAKGRGTLWVTDLLDSRSDAEDGLEKLGEHGFRDPHAARNQLLELANGAKEHPHSQHVRQLFSSIAPRVLEALADCGDPDAALFRLGRVIAEIKAPATVYGLLNQAEHLPKYLVMLVDNSEYLTNFLIQDPGLFDTLGRADALEGAPSRNELAALLASLSRAYDADAALYRLRAGELLRIGMRDLFGLASVSDVGRELTQLAEVCLGSAIQKARLATAERLGKTNAGFAILGLGKLGGAELGYGSDLDVIFVYDGSVPLESRAAPAEYFADVASRITRRLKEPTQYGILYDVDARLRPWGKDGPLAVSLDQLHEYYTETAEAWELLALMKARAVGGHRGFETEAEHVALDAAYATPLTKANLDRIDEIRLALQESKSGADLKRGEGGIGELEFAVRLLQLEHAAQFPAVRTQRVDDALNALREAGALDSRDTDSLLATYEFYRRVENRIRLEKGHGGSTLPDDPAAVAGLARRLQIEADLAQTIAEHRQRVHTFYAAHFERLRSKATE
jgi:[glutamine synthetase] adenylyltransferase / [glutamine synthetase]-adenylyl-L-tyrosine phosphorylase